MIGRRLAHYRILEKLGAGGMGEVYRAHDEQLDRPVALKVLPAQSLTDETARARLLREARAAAALNHPGICTIHEVGEADGQAYIAMELVEGQPLSVRLAKGALPTEQVLRFGLQLAEALAHAHQRGVVHRDLKSANVIVTPEGRAKVLDFGLAKRLSGEELAEATTQSQASLTEAGALAGTVPYMAPEQLRGQPADARSDIWALGVVLYEMAAGARPFQAQTGFELSAAILREPPPPLPAKVPVELRAVIERCLEKDPEQRYQQASELRAALEAVQSGAVAPWVAWRYRLKRHPWLALAGALVVLVAVLAALNVGGLRTRLLGTTSAPKIESLAVLPLANLSGDPEQEYFADGMTEALITDLAKLSGLKRVIARTSVMRYKGTKQSLREIAQELGVDGLVTGSALQAGGRVRITAQLIRAASEELVWAERYERDLRDVLSLQNEVVAAIARQIELQLTPQQQTRLATARPVNPEAYEAYLKGRLHLYRFSPQNLEVALQYFQFALEKDPNYALAHVGLADAVAMRAHTGQVPARAAFPKAKEVLLKALALDDTLAEAHDLLARFSFAYDWDRSRAEREFLRSIELNPNYPDVHAVYSQFLAATGRGEEAVAEAQRSLELDPLNPFFQIEFGDRLLGQRRHDDAIAQFQKALRTEPNNPFAHRSLWSAFYRKGMQAEALEEAVKYFALQGRSKVAEALAQGYHRAGYPGAMRRAADTLAAHSKQVYVAPIEIAVLYASAGDKDRALEWLEKAYQERSTQLVYVAGTVDPLWDPLRSDPRFQDLLRRMNFPP